MGCDGMGREVASVDLVGGGGGGGGGRGGSFILLAGALAGMELGGGGRRPGPIDQSGAAGLDGHTCLVAAAP